MLDLHYVLVRQAECGGLASVSLIGVQLHTHTHAAAVQHDLEASSLQWIYWCCSLVMMLAALWIALYSVQHCRVLPSLLCNPLVRTD